MDDYNTIQLIRLIKGLTQLKLKQFLNPIKLRSQFSVRSRFNKFSPFNLHFKIIIFIFFSTFLSSCNEIEKSSIYENVVAGKKLTIYRCLRKTYVSNYLFYQFNFDNTKPFEVNSLDYENGLPYRTDVFNTSPVKYFDTVASYCRIDNPEELVEKNSAYLNDSSANYSDSDKSSIKKFIIEDVYKNVKTERKRFLIYLSPEKYTISEFESIYAAILKDIATIDNLLFACQPYNGGRQAYDGWQLSGLVYGNADDFCETYTKSKEDYFKIFPNGRIAHYNELAVKGKNWLSSQNYIYPKIVMPGKTILLKTYTKNDLKEYKNQSGKSLVDNFNIEQGEKDSILK